MKRPRVLAALFICLMLGWLLLCAFIGIKGAENALHPNRRPLTEADTARAGVIARQDQASLDTVEVRASDGAVLRAWLLRPAHGNGSAVILLHGQSDNRAGSLGGADLLLRHGYAVLLPDARAHGASGGETATYGRLEADDIRRWYLQIQQSGHPHCIYGMGASMGAAQLLQALPLVPGFCAIVAESTFSSFREVAYDRMGQLAHARAPVGRTLLRPAVEAGLLYTRWKYGIDFERASPADAVAGSAVPLLLIHGQKDQYIPPRHGRAIVKRNPAVVLWEPAGAGHCGAWAAEPAEYERRVTAWFAEHTTPSPG